MLGHRRYVWHLAASLVLAALLAVPLDRASRVALAADVCTLVDEIRGTTCRLIDGETVEGVLDGPGGSATYRVDVVSTDATLDLVLAAKDGGTEVSVLDWRGKPLGTAVHGDGAPEARLAAKLPLPGVYGVRVSGGGSIDNAGYRLTATLRPPPPSVHQFWPPPLLPGAGPLRDERQVVRTPREGTPATPSVHGRALGAPPDGMLSDFTFVADVQFEHVVGPSALTVRFRYEPEAGGGSGYLFQLDPFGGTVSLDTFEEGQRQTIVSDQPLAIVPTADGPNRLILTADGPSLRATLDGQQILEASDGRFTRGLVVVGAVTWSDPVAVTFDHIQVTTPHR
jgi:hypothetical protein